MLITRFGTTTAPKRLQCSGCPTWTEVGELVYYQEVEPVKDHVNPDVVILQEFTTWCPACYTAIKDASLRLKIPIEFDVVPDDTSGSRTSLYAEHQMKARNF